MTTVGGVGRKLRCCLSRSTNLLVIWRISHHNNKEENGEVEQWGGGNDVLFLEDMGGYHCVIVDTFSYPPSGFGRKRRRGVSY